MCRSGCYYYPFKNSVSVNADAIKTSAGALHTIPVCRENNLTNTIKFLKDSGFKIVAATEKGDYDYTKATYTDPTCIIMGAEDTGVLTNILLYATNG